MTWVAAVLGLVAAAVALAASVLLVSRLECLAARFGLTEAILGVLVALAADAPEISSAVTAFLHGQRTIGSGVVLGSNVFNLAALLGLGAIVAGRIPLHRRVIALEGITAIAVALAALGAVLVGAPLLGLLAVVVVVGPYLVVAALPRRGLRVLPRPVARWLAAALAEEEAELEPAVRPQGRHRHDAVVALGCVTVVVVASAVMEQAGERLAPHLGISKLVLGAVVLAAVTSLPNAVGAVYLASRGRGTAVLSEAMNSNMLNVLAGLLVPGAILGIAGASGSDTLVLVWYVAMTAGCLLVCAMQRGLTRPAGAAIIAAYGAFLAMVVAR